MCQAKCKGKPPAGIGAKTANNSSAFAGSDSATWRILAQVLLAGWSPFYSAAIWQWYGQLDFLLPVLKGIVLIVTLTRTAFTPYAGGRVLSLYFTACRSCRSSAARARVLPSWKRSMH